MPAIFWLQCLALTSSSRAWPAPTMGSDTEAWERLLGLC